MPQLQIDNREAQLCRNENTPGAEEVEASAPGVPRGQGKVNYLTEPALFNVREDEIARPRQLDRAGDDRRHHRAGRRRCA